MNESSHLIGKDKPTKWFVHPIANKGRTMRRNVVKPTHVPGAIRQAKNVQYPLDAWQLFFPDSTSEEIVTNTNLWIEKQQVNYNRSRDALQTNITELKTIIGLLFLAGTLKGRHLNLKDLWSKDGTGV